MSANSPIEWTDHTFNPWWGCVRVSPGCEHCYAETMAKRFGQNIWGPAMTTSRRLFGEAHWRDPLKWDREAAAAGQRRRVFCASMADVFEDHPQLREPREHLFELIDQTPNLDWLVLTKRPANIVFFLPSGWIASPRPNLWLGTSVEDQQRANERIPILLEIPAAVRFLSCEPLLGQIDLSPWFGYYTACGASRDEQTRAALDDVFRAVLRQMGGPKLHWIIAGGESGPNARPMDLDWARSLRDQCQAAGVAFHFKQHGGRTHSAGGRELDGRTWDEYPSVRDSASWA